jgi:hypothetical protein
MRTREQALILLDSRDRNAAEKASDFSLNTPNFMSLKDISHMALTNCRVEFSIPPVNDLNNYFDLITAGPTVTRITLVNGWYDIEGFAAEVEARLQAVDPTFTVTVPPVDTTPPIQHLESNFRKLTIDNATNTFGISGTTDAGRIMSGLSDVPLTNWGAGGRTFGYASLRYTRYIDIESPNLTRYSRPDETSDLKSGGLLNRIYIRGVSETPFSFEKDYKTPKWVKFVDSSSVGEITIRLKDEFGNMLLTPEGDGFQIALTILVE